LDEKDIEKKITEIVEQYTTQPHGISKTELTRIYTEKWGTSKTTIWDYILDMIDSGKIELRMTKKKQNTLFIPEQK